MVCNRKIAKQQNIFVVAKTTIFVCQIFTRAFAYKKNFVKRAITIVAATLIKKIAKLSDFTRAAVKTEIFAKKFMYTNVIALDFTRKNTQNVLKKTTQNT